MLYNTVDIKYKLSRTYDFFLIRYNSKLGRTQYSVRDRGLMVWNVIPKVIRDTASLQVRKENLGLSIRYNLEKGLV